MLTTNRQIFLRSHVDTLQGGVVQTRLLDKVPRLAYNRKAIHKAVVTEKLTSHRPSFHCFQCYQCQYLTICQSDLFETDTLTT